MKGSRGFLGVFLAIGTGGSINGGNRHVTLRGINPHVGDNGDLSRIGRAVATEDYDGLATGWSLTTQTACTDR